MHLSKYIKLLLGVVSGSTLVTGCIYDDTDHCEWMYYMRIIVENHWENAPDASPEGIAYFFFPEDGNDPWRFDLPGKDGGEIKIPTGRYNLLMVNDDTSVVTFSNENSYSEMSASTVSGTLFSGADLSESDIAKLPELSDIKDQKVCVCPEMMWSYAVDGIDIELTDDDIIVPTYPRRIVCNYHYDITGVKNLDGVARMSGAISGMAESICLSNLEHSSEAALLPLEAQKKGDDVIHGDFLTYGLTSTPGMSNYLLLFVKLTDGKQYIYKFDVTAQTINAPDPMNVRIRIDGLNLPESIPGDTGAFDVSVDGWSTIVINLTADYVLP